jgi:hypothetical protein
VNCVTELPSLTRYVTSTALVSLTITSYPSDGRPPMGGDHVRLNSSSPDTDREGLKGGPGFSGDPAAIDTDKVSTMAMASQHDVLSSFLLPGIHRRFPSGDPGRHLVLQHWHFLPMFVSPVRVDIIRMHYKVSWPRGPSSLLALQHQLLPWRSLPRKFDQCPNFRAWF